MMASALLLVVSWAAVLASVTALDMSPVPFHFGYTPLFGDDNLVVRSGDGSSVRLKLDKRTGNRSLDYDLRRCSVAILSSFVLLLLDHCSTDRSAD
jgi:hypothetical protein